MSIDHDDSFDIGTLPEGEAEGVSSDSAGNREIIRAMRMGQ
jgi:hypothetical protein